MRRFRALGSFLGARCLGLFAVGQVFALLLAGVEYSIAIFLIVFLYSVKLVDITSLNVFHTPAAALVAFLYLFLRFEQMVANGSNLVGGLFSYRHHLDKLVSLISSLSRPRLEEALSPASRSGTDQAAATSVDTAKALAPPAVELREVSFAWEAGGPPVFSDISHSVAPGRQLAIVGPNGCGKSTLLSIVLGALRPCAGKVLIGEASAADYVNRHADSVAFVGSQPYLVHGSIRENLTYGLRETCTDEDLWRAIEDVGLAEFVRGLPEGLVYPNPEKRRRTFDRPEAAHFHRPGFPAPAAPVGSR